MNMEQQQFPSPPLPPPPTAQHSNEAEYVNCLSSNVLAAATTTTAAMAAETLQPLHNTQATTYVTINMLPPTAGGGMLATSSSMSATTALGGVSSSSTSTFKTPLLPMPTLEDIEGGVLVGTATTTTTATAASCSSSSHNNNQMSSSNNHMNSNNICNMQPIPGGILKYPNSSSSCHRAGNNLSLAGMGSTPPTAAAAGILTTPLATTTALPFTLPAAAVSTATMPQQQQQQQQQHQTLLLPPATLTLSQDAANICGTLKSNAKLLHAPPPPAAATVSILSGASNNGGSSSSNNQRARSSSNNNSTGSGTGCNNSRRSSSKCCACFGASAARTSSASASTAATAAGKAKRHQHHQTQTLWSALLTNLGICALLLAYTLLGSFIFLTIESEDSSLLQQQQRTLASTKRNAGSSGRHTAGAAASIGYAVGVDNIYQAQPATRLDNGTASTGTATAAAVAYSAASSSSSSSALEGAAGGLPMHANDDGDIGMSFAGYNNDFIYGDDAAPQLALSADTYDVRQRTIENIWDITVSLNILYKENWTKLAALEIAKFQDQLIKRLNEDALLHLTHDIDGAAAAGVEHGNSPATEAVLLHTHHSYGPHGMHEWNFAKAFLYSLTVLTTIGYGNIAPRTTLGRLVTLAYAIFGIPLTLVYLSSTGGILAKVAREVFSKALCCCLCSNCGYCCYDEKRMAEKERRTKRKRQQEELRKQQAAMQEPYYVRSGSLHDAYQTPEKQAGAPMVQIPDIDSLSASESRGSMHGLSILAPILLCLSMMIIYIMFGAVVLYRLENWPLLDGIYFCFMSLSTIGFGDMLPGMRRESTTTTWFCSIYIMSGMALTAMCFNVIHEEIVHRIKIVVEFKKGATLDTTNEDAAGYYMPP